MEKSKRSNQIFLKIEQLRHWLLTRPYDELISKLRNKINLNNNKATTIPRTTERIPIIVVNLKLLVEK